MPRWPVDRCVEGDGGLSVSSFVPMLPWCDSGGDSGDVDGSGDGGGGDIDGDGGGRVLLLLLLWFEIAIVGGIVGERTTDRR